MSGVEPGASGKEPNEADHGPGAAGKERGVAGEELGAAIAERGTPWMEKSGRRLLFGRHIFCWGISTEKGHAGPVRPAPEKGKPRHVSISLRDRSRDRPRAPRLACLRCYVFSYQRKQPSKLPLCALEHFDLTLLRGNHGRSVCS